MEQGQSVVLDAVFADKRLRNQSQTVATSSDSSFVGLWLSAPKEVLIERVAARQHDASDANQDVVKYQLKHLQRPNFLEEKGWHEIDASGSIETVLAHAMKSVGHSDLELKDPVAC